MDGTQDRFLDDAKDSIKDPDDWDTGDEGMTQKQKAYLHSLCDETGEEYDSSLTKSEAAKRITELKELLEQDGR